MPQVKRGSRDPGVHVPGVYEALLEYERARYESRGEVVELDDGRQIRVLWRDKDDHSQGFFLWPRNRLDPLEAGCTVGLHPDDLSWALWQRDRLDDPLAPRRPLPFGRGVRWVRVSPDDRVVPAADRPARKTQR